MSHAWPQCIAAPRKYVPIGGGDAGGGGATGGCGGVGGWIGAGGGGEGEGGGGVAGGGQPGADIESVERAGRVRLTP
eukprot:7391249-Prymnesium_polylepis.1